MKDKIISIVAFLTALWISFDAVCGTESSQKRFRRIPSAEEQKRMHEEVHFPIAREDSSLECLSKLKDMPPNTANSDMTNKYSEILHAFTNNTFAELPISKMKCSIEFDARLKFIQTFLIDYRLAVGTNELYAIADFIGKSTYLSVEKEIDDLKMVLEIRKHLSYQPEQIELWKTQPERYNCIHGALMVNDFRELADICIKEYDARKKYNLKLRYFRVNALRALRAAVEGVNANGNNGEKSSCWEEVCRRAKVTTEELQEANR